MVAKKSKKKFAHGPFLAILLLFAGFSLYAITSFFSSTNDYINNMYVSVTGDGQEDVVETPMAQPLQIFTDMDRGHIHAEAIEGLYDAGIVEGYDDGSFRPNNTVNRAELLVVLSNAVDADFSGPALENCFTDVQDQWFSVFVCYAKNEGWIVGFDDGSYRPDQSVIKAEVLSIVFEAFDYELCDSVERPPYGDVSLDDWYAPHACAARRDGIIEMVGFFSPEYTVTRAEFSQIVYNVMKKMELL